ncbi:Sec-independent protein translocase protein TatB [Acinetobacter sp. WCHAc060025]|uniref:Sec-independent protein translocase protein TatB n=1 Tax=Acinetobacter sp. WCHAc060025 TaxID=2518625 RepID=UPI001022CABE|nr:Sec-independent protein translocase protein TatB [Acinetobacter sp. WCHAc060025]RZG77559.1 twin-arginine translocase subunit TatB [Acinetobacter sp. WCHAc060025]
MLDVGFSELLVFGIIALLVLGPEKLPEAARFAAKWYSKFKRAISNVQNDIDRELRLSEFREQMQQEMQRIQELEKKMEAQMQELQQQKILAEQETSLESKTFNKSINYYKTDISMPLIYQSKNWFELQNCSQPTLRIVPIETNTPELKVAV